MLYVSVHSSMTIIENFTKTNLAVAFYHAAILFWLKYILYNIALDFNQESLRILYTVQHQMPSSNLNKQKETSYSCCI